MLKILFKKYSLRGDSYCPGMIRCCGNLTFKRNDRYATFIIDSYNTQTMFASIEHHNASCKISFHWAILSFAWYVATVRCK